jgi:K+-sensing histidine kinase KdpD
VSAWQRIGPALRGPQFLLDDRAARHIEAFLNQARLVLVGCLLLLGNLRLLPGSNGRLLVAIASVGVAWVVLVALLTRYAYRPWVAIAFALVDTLLVSLLVYWTGGPSSPLDALYAILMFAAAIRFTRAHSLLFTLTAIAAYAEVTWLHPSFVAALHANGLASRTLILAVTGVLAWLASAEVAWQRRAIVEANSRLTGLELINEIGGRFQNAHDFGAVFDTAAQLVGELVDARSVTVAAPSRGESSTELLKRMWTDQCAEIVATAIGPRDQPQAWLYVGTDELAPLSTADRALVQRIAEEAATALERNSLLQRERERSASLAKLAQQNRDLLDAERMTVARLRQLATHKEGFIDMVAHELRTPLTSVKGFAQLLLRAGSGPNASRRYVELILGESNRLMRIIDDIVDLSRMERGILEMQREPIELTVVIAKMNEQLESSGIHPTLHLASDLPPLRGDVEKLCQALVNLVHAGARYHQGPEPMALRATSDGSELRLRLDVAGTVPEHRLAHVFDRMPSGTEAAATGLSLYIAKNFVEAHGGRLWLETVDAEGRLYIALPAAGDTPSLDQAEVNRTPARPAARRRSRSGGLARG